MRKIILGLASLIAIASVASADGSAAFKKCTGCHGAHGEKAALGKSKIMNQMSKSDISTALKGYKNGTYGGPMKAIMKAQVAKLSDEDITSIAEYIGQ